MNANLSNLNLVIDELNRLITEDNQIILLRGTLGSGKTTLIKEFVKSKNLNDTVTSPTFSLMHRYSNNIFHYDIYNAEIKKFIYLGVFEELEQDGIHFVEWGDDKFKDMLLELGFSNIIIVDINITNSNEREYKVYKCTDW